MHTTMMNFHYPSLVVTAADSITSFSPAGTPSPPSMGYHLPAKGYDLMLANRRPSYMHIPYQHHNNRSFTVHDVCPTKARPKKAFTIEALLGLNEDSKEFVGAIRHNDGRRERMLSTPYSVPSATPRTSLTALLPQSPESSPEKDESKCRSHRLTSRNNESDVETKFNPHSSSSPDTKYPNSSCGQKSPPHNGKMKRIRTIFTPEQLERLEGEFERQQYMVGPERLYLASTLNLSESQVKIWFQNRRIKWRKQHVEIQQARLAQIRENGQSDSLRESDGAENDSDEEPASLQQNSSPGPLWDDCSGDRN